MVFFQQGGHNSLLIVTQFTEVCTKKANHCCCMLLVIICLSLSVFRLYKTVSVKNGWPAKRMLHWQPATIVYFNCSLLSVTWRIKYYSLNRLLDKNTWRSESPAEKEQESEPWLVAVQTLGKTQKNSAIYIYIYSFQAANLSNALQ